MVPWTLFFNILVKKNLFAKLTNFILKPLGHRNINFPKNYSAEVNRLPSRNLHFSECDFLHTPWMDGFPLIHPTCHRT